jgi:hypothetical protein
MPATLTKPVKNTRQPTKPRRPLGPNGEPPRINWTVKGPGADPRKEPLPPVGKEWRLEKKPLSFFKDWHGLDDNHVAALEHTIASGEEPIPFPQVDETGHGRDGHHRVAALKKFLGSDDAVIPMWVLHLKDEHKAEPGTTLLPPMKSGGASFDQPMKLAREDSYSWLDPQGNFHPIPDGLTHAEAAVNNHRTEQDALQKKGWQRVTLGFNDTPLYADNEYMTPNSKQKKALIDHAIEEGHKVIVHSTSQKEHTLWAASDENPERLAATQAPAGGMIVNNQYQTGGRFLPRALLSIRQAIARKKGRSASEGPEKLIAPLVGAATGLGVVGSLAAAGAVAGTAVTLGSALMSAAPSQKKEQPRQMSRTSTEHDVTPGVSAATHFVSPTDLNPTLPRRVFTDDEVRRIEDAHGLKEGERLVRKVDRATGKVASTVPHLGKFLDAITKKRLGPKLHAILNDPATPDEVRAFHLFHHVRQEAEPVISQIPSGEAARWYGESVGKWEAAMHHLLSRDVPVDPTATHRSNHAGWGKFNPRTGKVEGKKPFLELMKGPLAFTSGDATPSKNAYAALRMVRKAVETDPGNPFLHLPEKNHDELREWITKARQHLPEGAGDFTRVTRATPEQIKEKHPRVYTEAWAWHQKHGQPINTVLEREHKERMKREGRDELYSPGYSQIDILVNRDTGEPAGLVPFRAGDPYKPWPGMTAEGVLALAKAKKLRPMSIPNPGPDGHLQAKGWGKQSAAIVASSRRLGKLVSDLGPEAAAKWLRDEHPVSEIMKYHPNFSWGALPKSPTAPGSYIFGEKFGPFYQNLVGKDTAFTLDKWMARHAYRAMGTLLESKKGGATGIAEVGRTEADKRVIGDAFRRAAKHLGLGTSDLQALIWDMEQSLYTLFGVENERDNFHVGGQRLLQRYGFNPQVIEPTGSPPVQPVTRSARSGAQ